MVYSLIFFIWSIIHYFLQIGKGRACSNYDTLEECPIYDVIDWNKPGEALAFLAGAFAGLVVILLLYTGFFRCRDACCRRVPDGDKDVEAAASAS